VRLPSFLNPSCLYISSNSAIALSQTLLGVLLLTINNARQMARFFWLGFLIPFFLPVAKALAKVSNALMSLTFTVPLSSGWSTIENASLTNCMREPLAKLFPKPGSPVCRVASLLFKRLYKLADATLPEISSVSLGFNML
jgi:hypothetical protein